MKYYAQLNENKICTGISQLSGEVKQENMIEIPSADKSYLWKKFENGVWSEGTFEPVQPVIPAEPTNAEMQANQMVIMDVLATMYEDMLLKGTV